MIAILKGLLPVNTVITKRPTESLQYARWLGTLTTAQKLIDDTVVAIRRLINPPQHQPKKRARQLTASWQVSYKSFNNVAFLTSHHVINLNFHDDATAPTECLTIQDVIQSINLNHRQQFASVGMEGGDSLRK